MTGQNSLPNLRLYGSGFFRSFYVACNGVDIIASVPLRKSGQWDALQMVAHKKPNLFADLCTANLRFGITVAVNQDTKKKNNCNNTGQSQNTVHVKLARPQKLHNRVKQHKQAAGEKSYNYQRWHP